MADRQALALPFQVDSLWGAFTKAVGSVEPTLEGLDNFFFWRYPGRTKSWFTERAKESGLDENALCEAAVPLRDLALEMPQLFPEPIHILRGNSSARLSRRQVACLVLHSMLGNMGNGGRRRGQFNSFSADELLSPSMASAHAACVVEYLVHVVTQGFPKGDLEYVRVCLDRPPDLENCQLGLCDVIIDPKTGIEHTSATLHADFANKYIGGGALSGGNVQEEILFVVKPELLVSMALCPVMGDREAIVMRGAIQYSNYTGYGWSFRYTGPREIPLSEPADVVALDALVAFAVDQFSAPAVARDTIKAYAAFRKENVVQGRELSVATGNWGCGVFGGNHALKFCQQWIGASAGGLQKMIYCTFGDRRTETLPLLYGELRKRYSTVGELYIAVQQNACRWHEFVESLATPSM